MADHIVAEEWRPVVGWETMYEVSNLGRVRSLDRVATIRYSSGRTETRRTFGRMLKTRGVKNLRTNGRCSVQLAGNGVLAERLVHHLVMEAFVGPRPDGYEVNHLDSNARNNRLDNLEYCTPAQNIKHSWDAGQRDHRKHARGSRHGCATINEDIAQKIKERLKRGDKGADIARDFKVTKYIVSKINVGKIWRHV